MSLACMPSSTGRPRCPASSAVGAVVTARMTSGVRVRSWPRDDVGFEETKLWPCGSDAGTGQRGEQQVQEPPQAVVMAV